MFFLVDFHVFPLLIMKTHLTTPTSRSIAGDRGPMQSKWAVGFSATIFGECRPNFGRSSVKLRFATTLLLATKSKRDCRKMVENWIRIWISICPSLGNMFLSTRSGWIKKMVFFWYVKVKIQHDPTDILIIKYIYIFIYVFLILRYAHSYHW